MNFLRHINFARNLSKCSFHQPNIWLLPLSPISHINKINDRLKSKSVFTKSLTCENQLNLLYNQNNVNRCLSHHTSHQNVGLFNRLRNDANPYAKLIRLDRPIGEYLSRIKKTYKE